MKKIIDIYIFKEMIPNFVTSLVVFTFLVLAGRILRLTEWMVNHGVSLVQVLLITLYTLPYVLFFTLPMASLLASLIAFSSRMGGSSRDSSVSIKVPQCMATDFLDRTSR